jgi:hypothetical protein
MNTKSTGHARIVGSGGIMHAVAAVAAVPWAAGGYGVSAQQARGVTQSL